jgi:Fe-S cluster assembly protein SufD
LVLSEEAVADSMPGLEILADEVKCSHGATTGYLSEDELFYLQARGIPPQRAKSLLMAGFLDEVLQRLGDERVADSLRDEVRVRLGEI